MRHKLHLDWITLCLVCLLIFSTIWLRIANLDYSNLQGDEIKALCRLGEGQTLANFLLDQRKGPFQFLVTCVYSLEDPQFSSEFGVRIPFATASILAVFFFYKLAKYYLSPTGALYAALFLAINGLFVAFGRIVQYQSFTILFSILGVYGFTLAVQEQSWKRKGLYIGFIAITAGLLAHFDSVFALPPMALLLYSWWVKYSPDDNFAENKKHLTIGVAGSVILTASFYIPYAVNLTEYQLEYWQVRLTENGSITLPAFQFYNPFPLVWIYAILILLGFVQHWTNRNTLVLIATWIVPPLIFIELIMADPRTHFYTYLLPLLLVTAAAPDGLNRLLIKDINKDLSRSLAFVMVAFFLIHSSLTHTLLVDHTPEYNFRKKSYLWWELPQLNSQAIFGIPYNRNWRDIQDWFNEHEIIEPVYITNEKNIISFFYLPSGSYNIKLDFEDGRVANDIDTIYAILINDPHSFELKLLTHPIRKWAEIIEPEVQFTNGDGWLISAIYVLSEQEINKIYNSPH